MLEDHCLDCPILRPIPSAGMSGHVVDGGTVNRTKCSVWSIPFPIIIYTSSQVDPRVGDVLVYLPFLSGLYKISYVRMNRESNSVD